MSEDGLTFQFERDREEMPVSTPRPMSPLEMRLVRRARLKREIEGWVTFISGFILLAAIAWATSPQSIGLTP